MVKTAELSETSEMTFNAFIAWTMAAEPRLDQEDTLEETVELAILVDHLGVWASHGPDRVAVSTGAWKWSPRALNGVYEKGAEGRPLRRLVQATLLTANDHRKTFVMNEGEYTA